MCFCVHVCIAKGLFRVLVGICIQYEYQSLNSGCTAIWPACTGYWKPLTDY